MSVCRLQRREVWCRVPLVGAGHLCKCLPARGIPEVGTAYAPKVVERQKGGHIVNRQRCERKWKRSKERRINYWNNLMEELLVGISAEYNGLVGITWLNACRSYDSWRRRFHRLTLSNDNKRNSNTKIYAQLYSPIGRASQDQMGELLNKTGHVH